MLPAPACHSSWNIWQVYQMSLCLQFLAVFLFDTGCLSSVLNPCVQCPWDSYHQPLWTAPPLLPVGHPVSLVINWARCDEPPQADICHTQPQVLFEETGDVVLINVFVPTSRDWERELCCLIGELKSPHLVPPSQNGTQEAGSSSVGAPALKQGQLLGIRRSTLTWQPTSSSDFNFWS